MDRIGKISAFTVTRKNMVGSFTQKTLRGKPHDSVMKDAMTASAMFVSENPPFLVVSVAKHIVSHDLIEEAGEFVLNVASTNQVKLAKQLGFTHGRDTDKFKRFNISVGKARQVDTPVIQGSFANIECRGITCFSAAKYIVYLAEVVAYRVDTNLTPVAWHQNKY